LIERVLGVLWNITRDLFGFKICATLPTSLIRTRVLSAICSLYDPLGAAAPVGIVAKMLLQGICSRCLSWDKTISSDAEEAWRTWIWKLPLLAAIELPRCFKPDGFGEIKTWHLHHFADASRRAYAAVSYLRLVNFSGKIRCCFLLGKARVAPLKICSIPRLELTTAVLAVQLDQLVRRELFLEKCETFFWTDSTAVLQTLRNTSKHFPVFVANRLSKIEKDQMYYNGVMCQPGLTLEYYRGSARPWWNEVIYVKLRKRKSARFELFNSFMFLCD